MNTYDIIASVGGVVGILTAVVNIAYYFGSVKGKLERIKEIEEDIKELTKSVGAIKEKFYEDTKELSLSVTEIKTYMASRSNIASNMFARKHSPWSLNELGLTIFEDMKGREFINEYKDYLFSRIEKSEIVSAYDVEKAALTECILCTNEPFFKRIKDFVYSYHTVKTNDGKEKEVTLEDACFILSIPLRDMYLAEHPDITYTKDSE